MLVKCNTNPIEKFYVGKLNFGFRFGNLLVSQEFTNHNHEQLDLEYNTLVNGAISLSNISFIDLTNWDERIRYDSIFTVFYKEDEDTYICLHNGNAYHLKGENYCSDLVPLTVCIPEIASKVDDKISCSKARSIFDILFKDKKKTLYNNKDKYLLKCFYYGNLELYIGNDKEDANLAQRLMLSAKGIYSWGGYTTKDDESYSFHNVIVLSLEDGRIFNISENKMYDSNVTNSKLSLSSSLVDEEFYTNRIHDDKITIPKVLKLQRNYNKKR